MITANLLLVCYAGALGQGGVEPPKIIEFNQPVSFSYLAWENKVKVQDGMLVLNADGLTPKGGAGTNVNLDLSSRREDCPAIVVKLGPKNTMKGIKLMLRISRFRKTPTATSRSFQRMERRFRREMITRIRKLTPRRSCSGN